MAKNMQNLKDRIIEALGFAGISGEPVARIEQVFAEHAPAEKQARKVKRSPRKTAPARTRRTAKRSKK